MNTDPENPTNEIEDNIQPGITRRSFIKRTTATAIVTALALHAFRNEAHAVEGGSGSEPWTIEYQGGAKTIYPDQSLGTISVTENGRPVIYTLKLKITVSGDANYGQRNDVWSFDVTGAIIAVHPIFPTTDNKGGASASGTIKKSMTETYTPVTTDAGSTQGNNTANVLGNTVTTVECTRSGTSMAVKGTALGTSKTVTVTISLTNVKESSTRGVPPVPNPNP